jgi:hypothetical protein
VGKFTGDSKGFNPALIGFVFFTVCYRFIGATLPVSLTFGVIGGAAIGLIVAWWHKEPILNPHQSSKDKASDAIQNKDVVQPDGKYTSGSNRQAATIFDWLSSPEERR